MPPPPPTAHHNSVSTLLRRAHGRDLLLEDGVLTPQALLATRPLAAKLRTLSVQQRLIQQMHDAHRLHHTQYSTRVELQTFDLEDHVEDPRIGGGGALGLEGDTLDQLLSALYELRDALGPDDACLSTAEQHYLGLLNEFIVFSVAMQIVSEPHVHDNRGAGEALLTLSVRPTPLAREIAFCVLYDVVQAVSVWSTAALSHAAVANTQSQMFGLCVDMLTKSVAVASTSTLSTESVDSGVRGTDSTWVRNAMNCVTAFLQHKDGSYRHDRLVRLDVSALSVLLRMACSFEGASDCEPELQDQILETVVCTLYAQRETKSINTSRKSLFPTQYHSEQPISAADVEKIGGLDLLLAILYTTKSERSRRLILVVVFDLALEQLNGSKKRESDDAWAPSYASLLKCLRDADFAALVTHTPLSFAGSRDPAVAKTLHGVVENELLEKHAVSLWSALRAALQIDDYFIQSASLANAINAASHATSQQPHTHESLAERIVKRVQELLLATRMEDRFKGKRWLAQLLVHGLPCSGDTKENAAHGEEHLLGVSGRAGASEDPMEESFCFDQGAEMRLCARTTLWELAKSPSVGMRLAFADVLSLFTRRRLHAGRTKSVVVEHLRELELCLDALVATNEQSVGVLTSVLQTLLLLVVSFHEIPFLDCQRQKYDTESSDSPREVLGALVGSDCLASKLLRGAVALDLALVAELPLGFLLHALAVLNVSLHCVASSGCQGGTCGAVVSQTGDYAVVTALLVSHEMEFHATRESGIPSRSQIHTLAAYLDACDPRIAVIMARAIIVQVKHKYGERYYLNIVRELHAAAVDQDDESTLANDVAHARAVLLHVTGEELTP